MKVCQTCIKKPYCSLYKMHGIRGCDTHKADRYRISYSVETMTPGQAQALREGGY